MKLQITTLLLFAFCVLCLFACHGHEHLSEAEQKALDAAKTAHEKAYNILADTQKKLKNISKDIPADSLSSIESALKIWNNEAVGLPEEEGEHSHDHGHDEEGHHHHAPAPKVTMEEMQAIQEEMLKGIEDIKKRVDNLAK